MSVYYLSTAQVKNSAARIFYGLKDLTRFKYAPLHFLTDINYSTGFYAFVLDVHKSAKLTFPFLLILYNQISSYAEITCCLARLTYKTCPSPPPTSPFYILAFDKHLNQHQTCAHIGRRRCRVFPAALEGLRLCGRCCHSGI